MSTMTLADLRSAIKAYQSPGYTTIPTEVTAGWIDAIDAHLAAREADAVPYGWLFPTSMLESFSRTQPEKPDGWDESENGPWYCKPLYAAPVAQEAAAPADRIPCPECNGDKGHLGGNLGYVPCRDCDGSGFIESDDDEAAAPAIFGTPEDGAVQRSIREGFRPAFNYPQTAAEAVAVLDAWSDPLVMTFSEDKAKRCADVLRSVVASYGRLAGLQLPVAPPTLSDRHRAVMEAQGGVADEMVVVKRADLEALLECNRAAAQETTTSHSGIDFIEERGGAESDDLLDRVAYHLYYGLFPAMRIRDALAAHPHTGHLAVPDKGEK